MQDTNTVGEIFGLTPKPRGEGTWAWIRYHLIYLRSTWRSQFMCAQPGCSEVPKSHAWMGPTSAYCAYHSTPEQRQLRYARFLADCERNAGPELASPVSHSRAYDDSEPF